MTLNDFGRPAVPPKTWPAGKTVLKVGRQSDTLCADARRQQ
jgi:hypothetical protein